VVVATYKNGSAYKRVGAICVLHRLPEEMGLVDPANPDPISARTNKTCLQIQNQQNQTQQFKVLQWSFCAVEKSILKHETSDCSEH